MSGASTDPSIADELRQLPPALTVEQAARLLGLPSETFDKEQEQ